MSNDDIPERRVIREQTVVSQQPVVGQPVVGQPVVGQPVVGQPVTPVTPVQPVAATPVVSEARTTDVYDNPVERKVHGLEQVSRLIYFLFGLLEILLLFRFVLRAAAADPNSGFAGFIYTITYPFVAPFFGVLNQPYLAQTGSVFEFSTLLAIAVYALISWGLVKLLWIVGDPGRGDRTVSTTIDRRRQL